MNGMIVDWMAVGIVGVVSCLIGVVVVCGWWCLLDCGCLVVWVWLLDCCCWAGRLDLLMDVCFGLVGFGCFVGLICGMCWCWVVVVVGCVWLG